MSLKNTQIRATILLLWSFFAMSAPSIHTNSSTTTHNLTNYNAEKEELVQLFEQWLNEHAKTYAQPEDKMRAFKNFKENFEYVNKWNEKKEKGSHVLGLNKFADLSFEDYRKIYSRKTDWRKRTEIWDKKMNVKEEHESCNAPPSFDWRKHGVVSRVKDQGFDCGSCYSFAATGAIEGINAIRNGKLISVSEQEIVECDPTNGGCFGGYMDHAFRWVISNGGISSESDYPYTGKNGTCDFNKAKNKTVKIDGFKYVANKNEAMICALLKQPIGVSIVTDALDFSLYVGGIYDGNCSSNPDEIDHEVLLVGYGSENGTDCWIVKNSWGTEWGDKGYIYIKRDKTLPFGKCSILSDAVFPIIDNHTSSSQLSSFWNISTILCILFLNCWVSEFFLVDANGL